MLIWYQCVRCKGWQNLIERSEIPSNGSLLHYYTEQDSNYMPNEVFVDKDCRGNYTNPLRKITGTKKYDNCERETSQREKSFNWKTHWFFYGEVCVVIRSTLIAVKVGSKLVFSYLFRPLFWTMQWKSWKTCRWCIKAVVKQHWSSCHWCNISWTIFFYEKIYT